MLENEPIKAHMYIEAEINGQAISRLLALDIKLLRDGVRTSK